MADEELERLKELREIKRNNLRVIERQIAQFGEKWAPAHKLTERAELREAIAKYDTVLGSALSSDIGDDLGGAGRFILYLEELKAVKESIALYGYQLGEFIQETGEYRKAHAMEHVRDRRWTVAAALALLLVAAFVLGRLI